ncbi:MAG TPA: HAMP domain-containing sensor histidine kinase [Dissulfurispiraceae bacterium]|nr:HAMP domain-containing sensor histidine kinase [Dissulfurispiraceae bacterium]
MHQIRSHFFSQTNMLRIGAPGINMHFAMTITSIICLLSLLLPSDAAAFVTHDYPATFINAAARIYFLFACILISWAMFKNRLQKEKGWRYIFLSVVCLMIWDIVVFAGQISASRIDESHFIGSDNGWDYFRRSIALHGEDYFYYIASFDYLIIDTAMMLFYKGLREHIAMEEQALSASVLILPLMPVLGVSIIGAVVFVILSVACLSASVRLYRNSRQNILWNYMIWLTSAFLLFSISRSAGHILQHILKAAGAGNIWKQIEPISGSINIISFFIVGSISIFFIRMYDIYTGIMHDKKEIEDINFDLTELNQELEAIVAERTMNLMALTVADKVRNPAAVIGIVCKRVLKIKEEDTQISSDLKDVIDECEKLQNVVGDFESLLKTRRSHFTYENLNDIVRDVMPVIAKEAEAKGVLMAIHLSENPIKINMQKSLLRVAIFHVLRNAVDASSSGGAIRIYTMIEGDNMVLTITDAGMGIKASDMERIFDIFYSTKSKGFGMGLPLVKQIVNEHLGEVKVESEEKKGTTFKMIFPSRWKYDVKVAVSG